MHYAAKHGFTDAINMLAHMYAKLDVKDNVRKCLGQGVVDAMPLIITWVLEQQNTVGFGDGSK